jgi:hypothetical protein
LTGESTVQGYPGPRSASEIARSTIWSSSPVDMSHALETAPSALITASMPSLY